MGVTLYMPSGLDFFKIVGPESEALANQLAGLGYTFKLEFWAVKVYKGDALAAAVTMPVSTSNVLKKTASPAELELTGKALENVFLTLIQKAGQAPAKPAAPSFIQNTVADSVAKGHGMENNAKFKEAVAAFIKIHGKAPSLDDVQGIKDKLFGPPKAPTGAAPGVIKLENATALGQKVAGTSPGSIYHVIALNPRVKLAARLKGENLSLRAEGAQMTTAERQGLAKLGMDFTASGNYFSTHFELGDVPLARVLGAFLMGSGIAFNLQIKSAQELPNES